jgi:hypothetical protein
MVELGQHVMHLVGGVSSANAAELVLTYDIARWRRTRSGKRVFWPEYVTQAAPWRVKVQKLDPLVNGITLFVGGRACTHALLKHTIRASCRGAILSRTSAEQYLWLNFSWGSVASVMKVPMVRQPLHLQPRRPAPPIHCLSTGLFGGDSKVTELTRLRSAWTELGFGLSIVFTRNAVDQEAIDVLDCKHLERIPGIHCEARARLYAGHPLVAKYQTSAAW